MDQAIENNHRHTRHGVALLNDPVRNKGTAFTATERGGYGLEGLLLPSVCSLDRRIEGAQPSAGCFRHQAADGRAGVMGTKRTVEGCNPATDIDAGLRHGFIQET
jgi:hypothetical protein